MDRASIQEQFGANAASYAISRVHARGASLGRLVELLPTRPDWAVLDVATAAGHTAFALAPHVERVWATDITAEMLELAREQARARGIDNVTVEYADAEALPYPDATFDLVTCRIAPHHFGDVNPFLGEAVRVLKPGGRLAVVDNVVPPGPVGDYVNAFEKLRDPSHGRCLSMEEWRADFAAHGLTLEQSEILGKEMDFDFWAKRHDPAMQAYLRAMLSQAGDAVAAFLQPRVEPEGTRFTLREGLLIGRKAI